MRRIVVFQILSEAHLHLWNIVLNTDCKELSAVEIIFLQVNQNFHQDKTHTDHKTSLNKF